MAQGELTRAGEQIQIYEECETEFSPVIFFKPLIFKIIICFEMIFLKIFKIKGAIIRHDKRPS